MSKVRMEVRLEKEFDDMLKVLMFEQGINKSDLVRFLIYDKYQELYNRIGAMGMKELFSMMK